MTQRDILRGLWSYHGANEQATIRDFVEAYNDGRIKSNSKQIRQDPEDYARRLVADGKAKGWIEEPPQYLR